MTLIPHIDTPEGPVRLYGNPIMTRLDGEARAPLRVIISPSWSELDRAAYGVVMLEPQISVTKVRVDAERNRRIFSGITFNGVRFQTRPQDLENIHGAATMALAAMATGSGLPDDLYWHGGEEPFVWIAEDNSLNTFDAPTFFNFAKTTALHKSAHIFAARLLKDMEPIPEDFTDDSYWPS